MNSLRQATRITHLILLLAGFAAVSSARGQITVSAQLLDFGTCTGDTIFRTLIITNIGVVGADVTLGEPDGPFVVLESESVLSLGILEADVVTVGYVGRAGANASPNDSSVLEISFATKGPAPITGSLKVGLRARCPDGGTGNGNDSIRFSLQVLDFGNVAIGLPTTGTISIDNGSSAGATISVGTLLPPYSIGSGGGTVTIGSGGSHVVEVVITPVTAGTFNTVLQIVYHSGNNDPDTVVIEIRATASGGGGGNGGAGALITNRTVVNFGPVRLNTAVEQTVTLRNVDTTGTIDVNGSITGAVGGPFTIVSGSGSFDLGPGEMHTVVIRFMPTVRGSFADSAVVQFQATVNGTPAGNGRLVIGMQGEGRAAGEGEVTLLFSDTEILFNGGNPVNVGVSAEESVQITNPGTTPVDIRFTGPVQPFIHVNAGDTAAVLPGTTRNVVVRFTPSAAGNYSGMLQVIYGPAGNQNIQNITLFGVAADISTNVAGSEATPPLMLEPPVPNPAAGRARLAFTTGEAAHVTIALHNALGERVATLLDDRVTQGTHTVEFDSSALESGVYFCRMTAGERTQTRPVTVVR